MKEKYAVFAGIFVLLVILALWSRGFLGSAPAGLPETSLSPVLTPGISASPTLSAAPVRTVSPSPSPSSPFRGLTGLTKPGSCILSGEIEFIEPHLYESKNAKISWSNIDSHGRLINWKISPDDKLAVGPNIFEILQIPDGEAAITIGLPKDPKAKQYHLTASVTYGEIINDRTVMSEVGCSGSVSVKVGY